MKFAYSLRTINNAPSVRDRNATPSLLRLKLLLKLLGDVQNELKTVSVIGENGASQIASMISVAIGKTGSKCGLILFEPKASVLDLIRVNGDPIPSAEFCRAVTRVHECAKLIRKAYENPEAQTSEAMKNIVLLLTQRKISPEMTREELILATACTYFASVGCKRVVVTSSAGGKNDPAIALPPSSVCVVACLDKEDDSELSLIRKGVKEVVSTPQTPKAYSLLSGKCARESVRCAMTSKAQVSLDAVGLGGITFRYNGQGPYKVNIPVTATAYYAATTVVLADALNRNGIKVSEEAIKKGIASLTDGICGIRVVSMNPIVAVISDANTYYAISAVESVANKALIAVQKNVSLHIFDSLNEKKLNFVNFENKKTLSALVLSLSPSEGVIVICREADFDLTEQILKDAIGRIGMRS